MAQIEYEVIEIASTEKEEMRQAERNGFRQYGMRRDTGDRTYVKMRKEKKK
jgi:hypothetical protein